MAPTIQPLAFSSCVGWSAIFRGLSAHGRNAHGWARIWLRAGAERAGGVPGRISLARDLSAIGRPLAQLTTAHPQPARRQPPRSLPKARVTAAAPELAPLLG